MKSDRELKSRREFLRQSAAAAIFLGGALPASARDWEDYSARFSQVFFNRRTGVQGPALHRDFGRSQVLE